MKRFLKLIAISLVSILCITFSGSILNGCADLPTTSTGPIPNGKYIASPGDIYTFTNEKGIVDIERWEIKGDKAEYWAEDYIAYKATIVERDGKIYFECYKWVDPWSVIACIGKSGTEDVFEVVYDDLSKSITVKY